MTIKIVVPEGAEVEIVRDKWMPSHMLMINRNDGKGWLCFNKEHYLNASDDEMQAMMVEAHETVMKELFGR